MFKLKLLIFILLATNIICQDALIENDDFPEIPENVTDFQEDSSVETLDGANPNITSHRGGTKCAVSVRTRYGKIIGSKIKSKATGKTFYAFRGIRYALAPVGDLRFAPPVPVPVPNDSKYIVINGEEEGNICMQVTRTSTIVGSEDCLFLNVYVPKRWSIRKLPVIFWIHGGGFVVGSGAYDENGPDFLLNNDVIFVSINYRLGPLGFLATGNDVVPGNNGLKDQLVALKWVNENIAAFRGNPKQITIMGESAGAASVGYLLQSPLAKGLFKGAILLSGNTLGHWSLQTNPANNAVNLGHQLNISFFSLPDLITSLRTISARDIITAVNQMYPFWEDLFKSLVFAPVREPQHPGSLFSDSSYRVLENERLNAEEIMIGYTSAEGYGLMNIGYDQAYFQGLNVLVPLGMNVYPAHAATVEGQVVAHYYGGLPPVYSDDNIAHFITDDYFVRPTVKFMRLASKRNKIFGYKFTYEGELGFANRQFEGVGHIEDLRYIFKHSDEPNPLSKDDALTRERWCKLIRNFVSYGNPTPRPESIFEKIRWRQVSESRRLYYLEFGLELTMNVNPNDVDVKFWDNLYTTYGNPPLVTY